jgi:hypothetical protein
VTDPTTAPDLTTLDGILAAGQDIWRGHPPMILVMLDSHIHIVVEAISRQIRAVHEGTEADMDVVGTHMAHLLASLLRWGWEMGLNLAAYLPAALADQVAYRAARQGDGPPELANFVHRQAHDDGLLHRRQVLDEAADAILGELRYINTDRTCIERHAGIVRRLAATTPPAGHSGPPSDEQAEVVPEEVPEAPEAQRPSEGVGWRATRWVDNSGQPWWPHWERDGRWVNEYPEDCDRFRCFASREALEAEVGSLRPAEVDDVQALLADLAQVTRERDDLRAQLAAAEDCGHDLEAFERQARELAEVKETIRRQAIELDHWRTVIVPELIAERDRLADTIRRYQPVIDAVEAWRDASRDAQPLRLLAAVEALADTDQTDQGDDR